MKAILVKITAGSVVLLAIIIWHLFDRKSAIEEGRALERADVIKRTIEVIENRSKTNAAVKKLDHSALCRELGGEWVPDETENGACQ